ncbi:Transcription factor mbp1 [Coemansia sp. RSA 1646]|nr:Transcription factor mbp1 [Coemansia sp. RSA 1646]KAJ2089495.1 Transcription factor mbp1 [Coemansia sp. RSA 986]
MNGSSRNQVWSASYAGVEVFQLLYRGVAVMRRRKDSYINATQILKCAQYDKPRRTRFLEREIHTGIHEKVQGGYGKYQGTWVPLDRAVALAQQLDVYSALKDLFEYNPAPGEKPPTAPRSLESLNKRKSMDAVKGGAAAKPASKRRITADALPNARQINHNQHHAGSLATILNSCGAENVPPSHSVPQSASPSPPLASVYNNHSHYPSTCHNGSFNHAPQYHAHQPQQHTPGNHRIIATAATSIPYTPLTASHYTHNSYLTPETPENGRTLHHTSASGRSVQRPVVTSGSINSSSAGLALRDISNTYQTARHDDSGIKEIKNTPQMAKPGHSLLTPPSSSTIRRPVMGGYGNGGQASRTHQPNDDGLLMLLRPPVPSSAHTNSSMAYPLPAEQSRRLSGVQSWTRSPVTPSRPCGGGSASSAEHSRTASAASGASEPVGTLMNHARFVEFIKRPRAPGSRLPADVEWFIRADASIEPNAVVPNARGLADGKRYLHVAAANAHWDVVRLLVGRGSDATKADCDGRTALMAVVGDVRAWQQREAHVLEKLMDVLAPSLMRRDKHGRTALHWACIPPSGDRASDVWPVVSAYYVDCIVRKLDAMGQANVLAWCDYPGFSAEQLARQHGLDGACMLLSGASGAGNTQSTASSPDLSQQQKQQQRSAHDQYDAAAGRAEEIIRSSTTTMRNKHKAESRALDNDIEYAAQMLLELSGERDSEKVRAREYSAIVGECVAADRTENSLKRKIEHVVGLQQSARASVALRHSQASPPRVERDDAGIEALMAEYAQLRQSVDGYQRQSRKLAGEYAELAAVVRPWARPPVLSLLDMFSDGAEAAAADGDIGPAAHAVRETAAIDAESAEIKAINAVLETEQQRVHKLERVVSAACGDLTLDKVRTVVGPVLSVLNNGNTL